MNGPARTLRLTKILLISQLRSSRSKSGKARVWDRPAFILGASGLALSLSALGAFMILAALPASLDSLVRTTAVQVLAFVPVFALALVLLAGIIFELNASSKFASSDLVNWLPIEKTEYVAASAASVAYIYSPYICLASGITLALSIETGQLPAWTVSFSLSLLALLTGGILIEILRASINRVYTAMSRKTGRAALVLRLALVILLLMGFQAAVNPNLLFALMNRVSGTLDAMFFIPVFWPSLAVSAVTAGDLVLSTIYGLSTIAFVFLVFLAAVLVRSKYWAPTLVEISFAGNHAYAPRHSRLGSLGFTDAESSIIMKDFRGYVRQKELIALLALPFTLSAVLLIQEFTTRTTSATYDTTWLAGWLAGLCSVILASYSIGTEGRSFQNMYTLPVQARTLVRAKATTSLLIALAAGFLMTIIETVFSSFNLDILFRVLFLTITASVQSVFIGLYFATKYSDFTVRPKPRYISPSGMLISMLLGSIALIVTILPMVLLYPRQPYVSVAISTIVAAVVSVVAYRSALTGAATLMQEMRT